MNVAKFQLDHDAQQHPHSIRRDQNQMIMNGPRPSPLKISRGSYLIQKNTNSSSRMADTNKPPMREEERQQQQQQQRQPVIIYTQSPKVIHTQARDFMALVQKLTGLSPSDHIPDDTTEDHVTVNNSSHDHINSIDNNKDVNTSKAVSVSPEDNDQSSSGLTEENYCGGDDNKFLVHQGISSNSGFSPNTMFSHPSPYYADIPLFTPNSNSSTDFFCSPRPLYRYSDSSAAAPGVGGGALSPSMFKFIKGLPEY